MPRSKNNPSGKRNDPDVDRLKYAGGRKSEGRNYVEWMGKIADYIRKPLGIPKGERDRRVSAVPAAVLKSGEKLSHGGWQGTSPSIRETWSGAGSTGRTVGRGAVCAYGRRTTSYCTR